MKKLLISILILILSLIGNNSYGQWAGAGTSISPYEIKTKADLVTLSTNVNTGVSNYSGKYFIMTTDISLAGGFTPIGNSIYKFQGNFNGDGHKISNLVIGSSYASGTYNVAMYEVSGYVGLFGYIEGATLENIGIDASCSFYVRYKGGGLVGWAINSTINKCYSLASLSGFCSLSYGTNRPSTIVGGLIGWSQSSTIDNSYANASITYAGANSNATDNAWFGGLIGSFDVSSKLTNSYSSASSIPSQPKYTGALVGRNDNSSVANSYYISISGMSTTAGTSKTANEMKQLAFAKDLNVGCDNYNWKLDNSSPLLNNGYPILYWQIGGNTLPPCLEGGEGTINDPFRIRTAQDLIALSTAVGAGATFENLYLIVENNISFNTTTSNSFSPIGDNSNRFKGNFNGNGKVISNLTKTRSNDYMGLFGYTQNANIYDLGIENFNISSDDYGGGMIGYADNTTIDRCYSQAIVTGYEDVVRTGNWWNYKYSSDDAWIGGLIGYANNCIINNSYSRSTIDNNKTLAYNNEYNSNNYYGGLIGYSNNSTISNSYSSPNSISNEGDYKGSLVGYYDANSKAFNSYYLNLANMSNNPIGISKTLAQMRNQSFAYDINACQAETWKQAGSNSVNNGLPILYWQQLTGISIPTCWDGDGTEDSPFRIRNVADLTKLSNLVSGGNSFLGSYFIVENNISFIPSNSSTFNPIGDNSNRFQGNFNGNGKVISNLEKTSGQYLGLFGYIENATIDNLGIEGFTITNDNTTNTNPNYTGGLTGYASNSQINGCYIISSTIGGRRYSIVGGLIGDANNTTVNNCYARADITNTQTAGGGTRYYGGLIGYLENNSLISNSYSSPTSLTTTTNRGSLVGGFNNSSAINSYYLNMGSSSNQPNGSTSMTNLASMRTLQFAKDLNACQTQTWNHSNSSANDGLPLLFWQGLGDNIPSCWYIGSGTAEDPFRISSVDDLVLLSNKVAEGNTYHNVYFRVENYIDFIEAGVDRSGEFSPIGNDIYSFQANFDGNGKIISNLTRSGMKYTGLFGNIKNAKIEDIGLEGMNLTTTITELSYGGALVGNALNSEINNSYAISSIKGGRSCKVGGLIGNANNTKIDNCYIRGTISSGGVNTSTRYYGGLVGYLDNTSPVSNSYTAMQAFSVSSEFNRGLVVGGISSTSSTITNTYYDNTLPETGYYITGLSRITAEMKSGCFPTHLNNNQSPIVWYKAKSGINLGYPVLSWQTINDGGSPAGFEGNCLGYNTPFVGDENNKYKVDEIRDLVYISNMVANDTSYNINGITKYFLLLNDISFNDCSNDYSNIYYPIGVYSTTPADSKPFSGNFDGNRYAIANYSFFNSGSDNIGFFGYTKDATIKNLGISNISISAKNSIGGLVGVSEGNNNINSCFVYGYIKGGENVGGLVGNEINAGSSIDNSFTNVTIDAQTNVGGIVGLHRGTILNAYSNSEIYSSTTANDYVGGIIGRAYSGSINNAYSVSKIVRNGLNTNFGKIKGNTAGSHNNGTSFSRDNVFVNCDNASLSGFDGTSATNALLRNPSTPGSLGAPAIWRADYPTNINDGYPIFTYQVAANRPTSSGAWPNTSASQIVIIQDGVQLKTSTANCPKSAYVKIEDGGELNNTTTLSMFGEYNRELFVGKWNMIGLSTNNLNLASLINYNDIPYKTFVKRFDYANNNWQASTDANNNTITNINTQFKHGEGVLVMPNYSLDALYADNIKSKIISKGVLYNNENLDYSFNNTSSSTKKFVALANNYPASTKVTQANPPISGNSSGLIQGNLVYVYDADSGKWNNNLQTTNPIIKIKPSEGFFIAASSIGGNFLFDKSQISNTSGAKNTIISDLIYVQAIADNNIRESFLEFNDDADNAFDFNDGLMLFGNNYHSVEPYFTIPTPEINDSTLYLIKDAFSSLPYTTELDLRSQKSNEVSLNFSNIPSNIHIYLLDSLLNKAQYLNEEPNYNLQVNEGDNAKRLYVLFSYYKEDINEFFKPEMPQEIRIWNYNNTLNIEGKDLIRYEIYDVIGNKLLEQEVFNDDFQSQLSLNNGVYIVRAYSKTSTKTVKLTINN